MSDTPQSHPDAPADLAAPNLPPPQTPTELLADAMLLLLLQESHAVRAAALRAEKATLDARETVLVDAMGRMGFDNIADGTVCLDIKQRRVYRVTDWNALRERIVADDAWELLNKVVNLPAMREREGNNALPPGVEGVSLPVLKITWAKSK